MYQEKDKYRLLIENLPDGLAYCKMVRDNTGKPLDYIFLELNPSFEAIIGFPRDHIVGKKLTEVYPGIKGLGFDWIGVFDQVSAIDTGQNIHFQQYLNQQDRWYEITAYSDQLGYFAVVFRDITENKKAEEELRQREKNFSTLVENAPDMIVRFNLDLQHIYCNAAVEHQLGVPVHRFIGKTFLEIDGPPEELKFMHQLLKKALKTGKEQQTEQRFPLLFGQKYFQTRIVPERDEKGRIESLLAVTREITERKQAEEALWESDEIFKQFMENSPNYVFFKNDKDQAIRLSSNYEKMLGKPMHELLGKTMDDLFPSDLAKSMIADDLRVLNEGKQITVEEELNGRFYTTIKFPILVKGKPRYLAGYTIDITERKQMEEEIKRAKDDYLAITNLTGDIIVQVGTEGKWTFLNDSACQFWGKSREELIGKAFADYLHPDDQEETAAVTERVQKSETVRGLINRQKTPEGWRTVEWNASPVFDEAGNYVGFQATGRDITERKQAEEALRKSHERFQLANRATFNVIWDWNLQTNALWRNENFQMLFGYRAEEIEEGIESWTNRIHPEDLNRVKAGIHAAIDSGQQSWSDQYRFCRKDGKYAEINDRGYIIREASGNPVRMIGAMQDITERKQAEDALRESEERFRRAITATKDGLWERDIQTNQEFFAPRWCEITGYSFDDPELPHTYESWASRIHPYDYDRVMGVLNNHLEKGTKYDVDYRHRHKSGEYRWQNSKGQAIFDESGKPIKMVGFISDITERKQAEEALLKSERNLAAIMNASTESIFLMDLEGGLLAANESLAKRLGTDLETLLRSNFYEFLPSDVAKNRKLRVKQMIKIGKPLYFEDESFGRTILNSFYPIFDSKGQITRLAVIGMDITERKKMEERERHFKQVLLAIRNVNQLIVQETDPERLIDQACQILTETLGYYNAWIVLFDEDKKVISIKAYGFIDGYNLFEEQLKQGKYPLCIKKAFQEKGTIVIDNASDSCPDCPLYSGHVGRAGLSSRIQHGDKLYGMLTVSIPREYANLEETSKLFIELAGNLGLALYKISLEKERKKTEEELKLSYQKLQKAIKSTIQAIALILEKRDPYTAGHQRRMTKLACAIAEEISLSPDKIERLYIAGIIHDIGKINVPTEILSKPGRLSEIELSLIQTHPQVGSDILKEMELPGEVSSIVLQHHERMDGSGYPSGLSSKDIILEARILAVADVVEAMASNRPYRSALGLDKALEEITKNKGKLYDPEVVDVCLKLFKEKGFKFE
jgi:PAS domain S-box-containing protein